MKGFQTKIKARDGVEERLLFGDTFEDAINKFFVQCGEKDDTGYFCPVCDCDEQLLKERNIYLVVNKEYGNHAIQILEHNEVNTTTIYYDIVCYDRELYVTVLDGDVERANEIMEEAYTVWCRDDERLGETCCEEYICECLEDSGIAFCHSYYEEEKEE